MSKNPYVGKITSHGAQHVVVHTPGQAAGGKAKKPAPEKHGVKRGEEAAVKNGQ